MTTTTLMVLITMKATIRGTARDVEVIVARGVAAVIGRAAASVGLTSSRTRIITKIVMLVNGAVEVPSCPGELVIRFL